MSARADGFGEIQEVVTPKGLKAWLIENKALPMISVEVSFKAGSMYEPKGKEGLAGLTASLMDEGAGDYKAKEFKDELEAIGARFGAGADSTDLSVHLTTLSEHKERAFELMGLATIKPRFDADALERMRDGTLAEIKRGDEDPSTVAWRMFRPAVYGDHPYANNGEGTTASVKGLRGDDVRAWHREQLTRANMVISVVGNVSAKELAKLLDGAFDGLPEGKMMNHIAEGPKAPKAEVKYGTMHVPQGTVLMGHLGYARLNPDYYAMLVMNEILGGGVLTSRLGQDVREKHGLVYDVRSVNQPMPEGGMFYVSLATDNKKVEQAVGLVRKHLKGIREEKVSKEEFEDAKAYLIGSFPLRLDSNAKLLNMLSLMQNEKLGKDYLNDWPRKIAAVKLDDIQRVARDLIHPEKMVLVIVGDGPALKVK